MARFRDTARQLFSESKRRRRVNTLVGRSGLEPQIAQTYDTAAEGNIRRAHRENYARGRRNLDSMVQADKSGGDSRDLFHISVEM